MAAGAKIMKEEYHTITNQQPRKVTKQTQIPPLLLGLNIVLSHTTSLIFPDQMTFDIIES